MSTLNDCCSPCASSVAPVNIVGSQGPAGVDGLDGANGVNAFTTVVNPFNVPAGVGLNVAITVVNSSWMVVGQCVVIGQPPGGALANPGPATFRVFSVGVGSFVGTWLDAPGDVAAGTAISALCGVSPAGSTTSLSIAQLIDNSGGTIGGIITPTVGITTLTWHYDLVNLTTSDDLTDYFLGYAFKILSIDWVTTTPSTGVNHATQIAIDINATPTTGGIISLTSANTATKGSLVLGSAITANNIGTATGANSIITLRSVEANHFVDGDGTIIVRIQNLDTRDALASIVSKLNTCIATLS